MSLVEFGMLFEPHYQKKQTECEEGIDDDAYEAENETGTRKKFIQLKDNTKMLARTIPAVIRVPFFIAATDPENYYYSLLLQYMPYRQEQELLEEFNTAREAFLAREDRLKQTSRQMETYKERDRQLENAFNQVHAFEILDQVQPVDADDEEEQVVENPMTEVEFANAQNQMNDGQKDIFKTITQSILEQLNGSTDRLRLFITGGAGTGKTFVFKLATNQVNKCYKNMRSK